MKHHLFKLMSLWPPYFGAGIRIYKVDAACRHIEVRMRLLPWTRNYVGTHFGGSLYAMTDPFFMLMLIENLGRDYIVWDKAATIRFKKPGKGLVKAVFDLSQERLDDILSALVDQRKVEPVFTAQITDASGDVVAEVEKTLYIRRKDRVKGQ